MSVLDEIGHGASSWGWGRPIWGWGRPMWGLHRPSRRYASCGGLWRRIPKRSGSTPPHRVWIVAGDAGLFAGESRLAEEPALARPCMALHGIGGAGVAKAAAPDLA